MFCGFVVRRGCVGRRHTKASLPHTGTCLGRRPPRQVRRTSGTSTHALAFRPFWGTTCRPPRGRRAARYVCVALVNDAGSRCSSPPPLCGQSVPGALMPCLGAPSPRTSSPPPPLSLPQILEGRERCDPLNVGFQGPEGAVPVGTYVGPLRAVEGASSLPPPQNMPSCVPHTMVDGAPRDGALHDDAGSSRRRWYA